ncbi:MAG: hypothetical protein ACLR23_19330 [Clostridia bacterium]
MPLHYWKGDKDCGLSPETSVQEKAHEAAEWRGVMARWKRILARGLEDAMQLLYPPRCLFCQRVLPWPDRVGICTNCHPEEYYLLNPAVGSSAGRFPDKEPYARIVAFTYSNSGKSLFVYDGAVQEAIHRFKIRWTKGIWKSLRQLYGEGFVASRWRSNQRTYDRDAGSTPCRAVSWPRL